MPADRLSVAARPARAPAIGALSCLLLASAAGACSSLPPAGGASIAGAVTALGTRPAPALRVCAMPLSGGTPRCVDTAAGASGYRIDGLAAGRYRVLGWNEAGAPRLLAHAETIRCVRAPCPPDRPIAVEVAAGAALTGIDLNGAYAEIPAGWPAFPAR
jgi:hypothetical protein